MTYLPGTPSPNDAARTVEQEAQLQPMGATGPGVLCQNSTFVRAEFGGFCLTPNGTVIRGAPEDDQRALSLLNTDGEVKQKHVVLKSLEVLTELLAGDPENPTLQAEAQDAIPQAKIDALKAAFVEPDPSTYRAP